MRNAFHFAACATLLLFTTPVSAADLSGNTPDEASCGNKLMISKELVNAVTESDRIVGGALGARNNPYIIATLPSTGEDTILPNGGTIVFAKTAGWHAFMIEEGASVQGIRVSPDDRRVVIFTMHSVEGPGSIYTVMTTPDSFESIICSSVNFPKELNEPTYNSEFLSFADFNAKESGSGALIGSAEVKDKTMWYTYKTENFGANWTGPFKADPQETPLLGYLKEPKKIDLTVILNDLKQSLM